MRCNIGRFPIIHSYGGLHADLDTSLNCTMYEQARFAVCEVNRVASRGCQSKWKRLSAKKPKRELDMEIIIGCKGHPVFPRWLERIQTEIANKDYSLEGSHWYTAQMRYVYYTTGPRNMRKCLVACTVVCPGCGKDGNGPLPPALRCR